MITHHGQVPLTLRNRQLHRRQPHRRQPHRRQANRANRVRQALQVRQANRANRVRQVPLYLNLLYLAPM